MKRNTRTRRSRTSKTDAVIRGILSHVTVNGPKSMPQFLDRIISLFPHVDGALLLRLCLFGVSSPEEKEECFRMLTGN